MPKNQTLFQRFQAGFVALPDLVKAGIASVAVWVVAMVLANLLQLIPFLAFLIPFQMQLAFGLSAIIVAALEKAIPDAYGPVAVKVIEAVLLLLAMFGVGNQLAAMGLLPALLR